MDDKTKELSAEFIQALKQGLGPFVLPHNIDVATANLLPVIRREFGIEEPTAITNYEITAGDAKRKSKPLETKTAVSSSTSDDNAL